MTTLTRNLTQIDGANVPPPTQNGFTTTAWQVFANDAAYEAIYGAGQQGDTYFNSTELLLRTHNGTEWVYLQNGINAIEDSTSTGTDQDVDSTYHNLVKLTNASLVSVRSLDPGQTKIVYLANDTGGDVLLLNESAGATAANRLILPDATTFTLADGNTVHFVYDDVTSRWRFTNPAGDGGGGGPGGVFNYVTNPDAEADATTGVTEQASTGSWTTAQTTTVSELPEETSKSTAFKISGSGLTINDYKQFESVGVINDADSKIGQWSARVKDISGTISGEYKFQCYNVTTSEYIGESQTVVSDRTYQGSVPLTKGQDIVVRLIALTASPTNIGISGIKIQANTALEASVVTDWVDADLQAGDFVGFGTVSDIDVEYNRVGDVMFISGIFRPGTCTATEGKIPMPLGLTIDQQEISNSHIKGTASQNTASANRYSILAKDGDTFLNIAYLANSGSAGLTPQDGDALTDNEVFSFNCGPIPILEWKGQGTVLFGTEAQYQNAYDKYIGADSGTTSTLIDRLIKYQTEQTLSDGFYDPSTGGYTCKFSGKLHIDAKIGMTTTSSTGQQTTVAVHKNDLGTTLTNRVSTKNYIGEEREFSLSDVIDVEVDDVISIHVYRSSAMTVSSGASESRVAFTRVPDKSSSAVGFPFSDQATDEVQYLVPDIRTSGEGDLGTITSWATVDSKKYRWYVIGKMCFYEHRVESTTASSSTTALEVDLPSDVPAPKSFSNQDNSEFVTPGCSYRDVSVSGGILEAGNGIMFNNAGTNRLNGYQATAQATKLWIYTSFWQID